jgi:hypothetical protein
LTRRLVAAPIDRLKAKPWILVTCLLVVAATVGAAGWLILWWPVISHYRMATPSVDPGVIERHRHHPPDAALLTVADAAMMTDHPLTGTAAVAAARRLLQGELALPALPVLPIGPDFAPRDLSLGVPVQQLFTASLIVPDLLLRAHEHTPDPAFIVAAGRYLQGFIEFERRQATPTAFLWNDHAVMNRVSVLVRYWRAIRSTLRDAELPTLVHQHAVRIGASLSNPAFFVAPTNHGLMQNLGLLQLAAAFPALPEAAAYRRLALARLHQQLPFYINSEGVVLEHSAGYHFHGVVLTGHLVRVLTVMGQPVPANLRSAHDRSLAFLALLQRPDRSMPLWGNTYRYAWRLPRLLADDEDAWAAALRDRPSFGQFLPSAGAAVWWARDTPLGVSSHTFVTWGQFPGHGHPRAQDMSLLVWAGATDWITNSGYWPGNDPARERLADGWAGSNAPHFIGEVAHAVRTTKVLAQSDAGDWRFVDLARGINGGAPTLRRQVLQWKGSLWLILDSHEGAGNGPMRVVWTTAPEVQAIAHSKGRFELRRDGSALNLMLSIHGAPGISASLLRASQDPFGGWVAQDRRVVAASSIDARAAHAPGVMATVARLSSGAGSNADGEITTRLVSPDQWTVSVPHAGQIVTFARSGAELTIAQRGADAATRATLAPGPDVSDEHQGIARAVAAVRAQYPRIKTYEEQRQRVFDVLAALWASFVLACLLTGLRWPRVRNVGFALAAPLWLAAVTWASWVYLPVG